LLQRDFGRLHRELQLFGLRPRRRQRHTIVTRVQVAVDLGRNCPLRRSPSLTASSVTRPPCRR
jgi:hypothetical protein